MCACDKDVRCVQKVHYGLVSIMSSVNIFICLDASPAKQTYQGQSHNQASQAHAHNNEKKNCGTLKKHFICKIIMAKY